MSNERLRFMIPRIPPRIGRRWPAVATVEACKPVSDLSIVREALRKRA